MAFSNLYVYLKNSLALKTNHILSVSPPPPPPLTTLFMSIHGESSSNMMNACGCMHSVLLQCFEIKLPSLKLKTWTKQLPGFVLFSLPCPGILNGEISLYRWPPIWLVWNKLYDYWQSLVSLAKQTNSNQSNRRLPVQWCFPL